MWWTWTAPTSGTAALTTAGSNFRNALGVYTGPTVSNLTVIASHLAGPGTNTSQVTFAIVGGTTYQFAVDGFNGATGHRGVKPVLTHDDIFGNSSMPRAWKTDSSASRCWARPIRSSASRRLPIQR